MAIVWRLSLNPSKVEAVTTAVGNLFHRRIADGKKRLCDNTPEVICKLVEEEEELKLTRLSYS
jgi:hypothetical protein